MKEFRRVKKKIKSQMMIILIILFRILSLNFETPLELVGATTLNHISKRVRRMRKGPHDLLDEGTFSLYISVYLGSGPSLSFVSELLFNPYLHFLWLLKYRGLDSNPRPLGYESCPEPLGR